MAQLAARSAVMTMLLVSKQTNTDRSVVRAHYQPLFFFSSPIHCRPDPLVLPIIASIPSTTVLISTHCTTSKQKERPLLRLTNQPKSKPTMRIELMTFCLQNRCTTTVLSRLLVFRKCKSALSLGLSGLFDNIWCRLWHWVRQLSFFPVQVAISLSH